MPDLPDLKLDLAIILYICTIIENEIKQNQVKSIDKKSLVVSILSKIHPHTAIELSLLNKQIEFLHSNKLINKITKLEKKGSQLFQWALKKIAWNSFNYSIDYFDLNFYKKVKVKTITTMLIKFCIKKKIVLLIIALI